MDEYRMINRNDFTGFLSGFSSFVKSVVIYFIKSIRRNFIAALLVFIALAGGGIFYWATAGKLYESEMVCEFNNLSKKTYGEMVQKLDNLAKSKSYTALAATLHLSKEQATEIISIEGRNISGSMLYEDFTSDRGPMYFKVTSTSNTVFGPLQKALLEYLNSSSPFNLQRNEMERERISQKLIFLKKDIELTDSLVSVYPSVLKSMSPTDTNKISNFSALLRYKNQLEEDYLQQEWREKELKTTVELLYGFVPEDFAIARKYKKLASIITMAFLVACGTAVVLNILKEIPKT